MAMSLNNKGGIVKEQKYTVEELVDDKSFVAWALRPDSKANPDHGKWRLLHQKFPDLINEARFVVQYIHSLKQPYPDQAKEKLWERIKLSNIEHELHGEMPSKPMPISSYKPRDKRIAWSLLAAAVIAVFFVVQFSFKEPAKEVTPPVVTEIIKSNPAGQKSQVHLPDGSTVYLNAESELRYADNFASGKRDVFLQGEAFFKVVKDTSSPFSVHTDQFTTTVLGTSFNVNSYASEEEIEVALVTGKVLVQDNQNHLIHLSPGEKATLDKKGGLMEKRAFDPNKTLLWKEGIIYFDKTNLAEAIKTLERWYNVNIQVSDLPNKPLTCTGQFKREYLSNVLNNLGFSLGFTYEIQNKNVTINFN